MTKTSTLVFALVSGAACAAPYVQGNHVLSDGGVYVSGPVAVGPAGISTDGGIFSTTSVSASTVISRGGFIFFGPRSDGGTAYLEGDDPSGKIGIGGPGIYAEDGVSLPQHAHMCGYLPLLAPQTAYTTIDFVGTRFAARGKFTRLTADVLATGSNDAGLDYDGGPAQTFRIQVYDVTTGAFLCETNPQFCVKALGTFGVACGDATDGGGQAATFDDVVLRYGWGSCFQNPIMNVCAEYAGVTRSP